MGLFARRRLQLMLDEISQVASAKRRRHLIAQLESSDTSVALSFEAELAVFWAASKVCTVEPLGEIVFCGYPPDVVSSDLIPGHQCVVDVALVSDDLQGKLARRPPTTRKGHFGVSNSPLGNTIRNKDNRFVAVNEPAVRVTFILDGGSRNTANPFGIEGQWNAVNGNEIIQHAAGKVRATNVICLAFWKAEYRRGVIASQPQYYRWAMALYPLRADLDLGKLGQIVDTLPPLRAPPDRLRQLHRAGYFQHNNPESQANANVSYKRGEGTKLSLSSKLFEQLVLDPDALTNGQKGQLEFFRKTLAAQRAAGKSISDVEFKSLSPDVDDDLLVFSFTENPAVHRLR